MSIRMDVIKTAAKWVIAGEKFIPEVEKIAGRKMVRIPPLFTVRGAADFADAPPGWTFMKGLCVDVETVSRRCFAQTMRRAAVTGAEGELPAIASWFDASAYHVRMAAAVGKGRIIGLPTEAEWEAIARGPAVNVRKVMEREGVAPTNLVEFAKGRFENFVAPASGDEMIVGTHIFTDPTNTTLRSLLEEGRDVYAFRQYSTVRGSLDAEAVWFNQPAPALVGWGPKGPSGTKGMSGNVWEWTACSYKEDAYRLGSIFHPATPAEEGAARVVRGGAWYVNFPCYPRVAFRDRNPPGNQDGDVGFRSVVRLFAPGL